MEELCRRIVHRMVFARADGPRVHFSGARTRGRPERNASQCARRVGKRVRHRLPVGVPDLHRDAVRTRLLHLVQRADARTEATPSDDDAVLVDGAADDRVGVGRLLPILPSLRDAQVVAATE